MRTFKYEIKFEYWKFENLNIQNCSRKQFQKIKNIKILRKKKNRLVGWPNMLFRVLKQF